MFSRFGRRIFVMYEKHPVLMNCGAGSIVYAGGEVAVQVATHKELGTDVNINWNRVGKIGLLGSCENGILMSMWYWLLTRVVGASVGTPIVLTKCLLDQIFFSTQQNGIFLGLCALQDEGQLHKAIETTRQTFLTTWINDCAVWPLINFVGFAYVPQALQPTYMSCVQFFWQTYVSSVACSNSKKEENRETQHEAVAAQLISAVPEDGLVTVAGYAVKASNKQRLSEVLALQEVFNSIDTDHSGFLDLDELKVALTNQGVTVNESEVVAMMTEADSNSDGRVSFEEFVVIADKTNMPTSQTKAEQNRATVTTSSKLWQKVVKGTYTIKVQKGALSALKSMEDLQKGNFNQGQGSGNFAKQPQLQPQVASAPLIGLTIPITECMNESTSPDSPYNNKGDTGADRDDFNNGRNFADANVLQKFISSLKMLETPEHHQDKEWEESRSNAKSNAKIGLGLLCLCAIVRVFVFKK